MKASGCRSAPPVRTGSRVALGKPLVAVATVLIVVAVVGCVDVEGAGSSTTPPVPTVVTLRAYEPNGTLVADPTYTVGDPFDISITAEGPSMPVAVHEVFGGTVYPDLAWNVKTTGLTYVLRDVAHVNDSGVHIDYVVVTFADGDQVPSNSIVVTIRNSSA